MNGKTNYVCSNEFDFDDVVMSVIIKKTLFTFGTSKSVSRVSSIQKKFDDENI